MERDVYKNLMNTLRISLSDEGKISEIITDLSTDYEVEQTAKEAALAEAVRLKSENESLRNANMSLLVKFGVTSDKTKAEAETDEDSVTDPFEKLFDENGNLK